jgi:hypothetical protein
MSWSGRTPRSAQRADEISVRQGGFIMRNILLVAGCLLAGLARTGAAQQYPWCATQDQVSAEVAQGLLVLNHLNATYNCCADSFTHTVAVSNDSLYVTEHEALTMPCDCLCCYNIATEVSGLAPGVWQVVYRWFDDQPWGWRDWHLTIRIDGAGEPAFGPGVRTVDSGCLVPTSAPELQAVPAVNAVLLQNAPNPFNPGTTLRFDVSGPAVASLRVYDVAGRLVKVLLDDEAVAQGRNEIFWQGRDQAGAPVASGTYFYRLEVGVYRATRRMVLIN